MPRGKVQSKHEKPNPITKRTIYPRCTICMMPTITMIMKPLQECF